jgi:GntR family transcriptional regulator, transcriptional repressor for pyruvate dehydrogenase complex
LKEGMKLSKLQSTNVPGRFVQVFKEHDEILKAITNKDSKLAADAMRHHLIENERKIWNGFSQPQYNN